MAEIFVSYTSDDKGWADWIGLELEKLGHTVRIFDWEVSAGGNVVKWMEENHDNADHILCVVSPRYLDKSRHYSKWERQSGQLAAISGRENFVLPVLIEPCDLPALLLPFKRSDLHGLSEQEARARLADYLKPAEPPTDVPFPGAKFPSTKKAIPSDGAPPPSTPVSFPGSISNIPINVPLHFVGRDTDLAAVDAALKSRNGRAAITALHGLRGVGKTVLATAYAEQYHNRYRARWWIRAETESTMRADLVGLGVRLGWVAADAPEEQSVTAVLACLREDGAGLLLVYDNAIGPIELSKYLPRGAGPHVIVTSNAPNWRSVASPVEIEVWPSEVGANFLVERTGLETERDAAVLLSVALGGLPLAHEQAAAYCDRLGLPLSEYARRFTTAPGKYLDDASVAPEQYHNGLTVAKAFALAIEEAGRLHPAAERLITYAALLAPEPIPLYLFSEGREKFSEPFASQIIDDGLDEAGAALRAFALVDRELISDERDPSITTDCIRLHRLVREVAAARKDKEDNAPIRRGLIEAASRVYPGDVHRNPSTWPRARRLDAITMALADEREVPEGSEASVAFLLDRLARYRYGALAAYAEGRRLSERALAIIEKELGPDHLDTTTSLSNLGYLLQAQGDLSGARPYYERALAISEKALGPDHPDTATSLNSLGSLLQAQGDLSGARPYYERALAIREKWWGPDRPDTATSLNNLGFLLQAQGDLSGARPYYERALAIREKALGPDHPNTAGSLNNLGGLLRAQGDLSGARPYYERALAISEKALGPDHPDTATSLNNLGGLLQAQGDLSGARPYYERALAIYEKALGPDHPNTAGSLNNLGFLLQAQGDLSEARPYYERALAIREKALGPDHPNTAGSLNNLGFLLQAQGDLSGARPYYERALAIYEKALGPEHPDTARSLNNLGGLLRAQGDLSEARPYYERALAIREKALGPDHPNTAGSLNNLGSLLQAQGDLSGARPYYERALAILEKVLGRAHPETKTVAENTAGLLHELGFVAEAQGLHQKFGLKPNE